ncbi:cation:proton antiporter [Draconibacterium sp. IB214405]|uniref:cation:proton antiporter domain-containing protein n=1 Tax=Draconibacterium sp. IB214405 TaxID=3097352 RepID=UPI002A0BAFF7|nr:cation:proton antiporter [Draconibacterium sp. IB214405]MDX8340056.1 cation:proton antiporter [Draconibacterium sp. IB214405]
MNAYLFLSGLCVIIIFSFFTNMFSRKTNVPSVLILILLGVGLQELMTYFNMEPDYFPVLEILGIVGLIMIVLEAALDLELRKEKWPIIWKSFTIASLSLGLTAISLAFIIRFFIPEIYFLPALVYALPLSIMSSAIIIPSVANLTKYKKEFLIYESTFSDILGIMVFYMIIENLHVEGMRQLSFAIGGNIILTLVISLVMCYGLLFVIQNIRGDAKFFLFLAVLVLLYAVGKMFHLSSLIIILMFGLLLRNYKVLLFGRLRRWLNDSRIDGVFDQFKMITKETAFLVRTFFFVVFGMTLPLSTLFSWKVWLISVIFLAVTYVLRYGLFYVVERKDTLPQTFIAPKGLITVLLFFAIPESLRAEKFESAVLFVVIISTSLIMAWALIANGNKGEEESKPEEREESSSGNGPELIEIPLD